MFQNSLILFVQVTTSACLKYAEMRIDVSAPIYSMNPLESDNESVFGTSDEIVFDNITWKPQCANMMRYFSANRVPFSAKDCNDYVTSRSNGYADLQKASSRNHDFHLEFLHVSKSGGTFFCACGNDNGENQGKNHGGGSNCHYIGEDWPWWGNGDMVPGYARKERRHNRDCRTLQAVYKKRNITLEGNENFVPNGTLCTEHENVLIVRSPIHRLASNINHMTWDLYHTSADNFTLDMINSAYPRLSDNYLARSLGGLQFFDADFGKLPESLFSKAKATLHEFSRVFVMNEELTKEVEHTYGWNCSGVKGRKSKSKLGTQGLVDYWQKHWPKADWEQLRQQNSIDQKLFDEAAHLSFAQSMSSYIDRKKSDE